SAASSRSWWMRRTASPSTPPATSSRRGWTASSSSPRACARCAPPPELPHPLARRGWTLPGAGGTMAAPVHSWRGRPAGRRMPTPRAAIARKGERMQTWLVTGGAGFIGGNFVLDAVASGVRVVNLDALTYAGNLDTLAPLQGHPGHVFVHGDIGDRGLVTRLLAEHRPAAILNFAAESHVDRSIDGPAAFVQTNVVGTLNLLECARDYWRSLEGEAREAFRFLHVSTDEVYGSLGESGRFTEETPYAPNSPSSASKAASDHLVRAFHHTYGLPVLTTNCSNNYGPYQYPEKLIPLVIQKALKGEPLPVYGDGRNVRDWLYVK